jgi:hypothetical protein
VGEFFVVTNFEVAIGMIVVTAFEVPERSVDLAVWAGAEEDKLASTVETVWDSVENKVDALLMVEATDERDYRTEVIPQPEAISESFLVGILILDGLG